MTELKPRGFWLTFAVTGGAFGGAMLLLATLATLGSPMSFWIGWPVATQAGLAFGFAMAIIYRGETLRMPLGDPERFAERLDLAVRLIHFTPESAANGTFTYRPTALAGLLVGEITVAVNSDEAVLAGPRMYVRKLAGMLL